MLYRIILLFALFTTVVHAQKGDRAGEVQKQPAFPVPPSIPLSADEEIKTLKLQPGFKAELVASEPMVEDPVAMAFGPDGRIWVVEMRSYMPNVDGKGEDQPIGQVVVLEDTNKDGKMDKRTVFADGLVMPRAISLARGGALVAEPPTLWYMRDSDGDGVADQKIVVAKDYGSRNSPEHTANGLVHDLDNWIYSANYTYRFRSLEEDWKREPTAFRGQWGISQDDRGRLFFNSNEDQLRCDLVPSAYLYRNPNLHDPVGLNFRVMSDQSVWPARVNPGVNRGYRPGQLRPDGTLATFTAACAPEIYRGDNFPAEFYGNAFVCEPSGNLVKRDIISEKDVAITGKRAYDRSEFLASTDERFRPVNAYTGPDGALYIVDLYRGVLQHRIFVTSYLRKQIETRGLETPLHRGRIWRIVHEGSPLNRSVDLSHASNPDLVKCLGYTNGWCRDTAQRLLVERADDSVAPALRKMALTDSNPLASIHALWTLEGMGSLDKVTVLSALSSPNDEVRMMAVRLSDPFLKTAAKSEFLPTLTGMAEKESWIDLQLQLAFTLGQTTDPMAEQGMLTIAQKSCPISYVRDALISGLVVRELEFLEKLLAQPEWRKQMPGRAELLRGLAGCVFAEHKASRVEKVLDLAASQQDGEAWRRSAMLAGLTETAPVRAAKNQPAIRPKLLRFDAEPEGLAKMRKSSDSKLKDQVARIDSLITWPGQPGYVPEPPVKPLTKDQVALYEEGRELFNATCAQCHQPHGLGQEGLAPPLVDSEWALGPDHRLVRIALQGAHGRIHVKGRTYDLDMPSFGSAFTDEQIAAILTYVRRSWEHTGDPVSPNTVKEVRQQTATREEAWTENELLKIN